MAYSEDTVIVLSGLFAKGFPGGYGLIINSDRVLGAKKWEGAEYTYFAVISSLNDKGREEALKIAGELEKKKEFEVSREQVSEIEIKKPGRLTPGHLLFKTTKGEFKIKVSGTFMTTTGDILSVLGQKLEEFAPGKVKRL